MIHSDSSPGPLARAYLRPLKQLNRRRGVYPVWECTGCGLTNDPAIRRQLETVWRHLTESGRLRRAPNHGDRLMRLRLNVNRKGGAPGYGSDGAMAEVELDLDDECTPIQLLTQCTTWYHTLERAVDIQLDKMQAKHPQPGAAVKQPPAIQPIPTEAGREEHGTYESHESYESSPPTPPQPPPPARPSRNGYSSSIGNQQPPRNGRDDPPRSARELAGWMKTSGHKDDVVAWGKANGLPWQVSTWPDDAVLACYHDVTTRATAGQWGGRN